MRQIRVLQFITPSGFYGAERWVLALANNSDSCDVIYDLAVTKEHEDQDLRVAELYPEAAGDVHYIPAKGRFDPGIVRHLVRIIRERRIDAILTHGYKSDILGYLAARWTGIKCVSTPHGFSGNVGWKLRFFINTGTRFLKHFDAVAPLSDELVEDMRRFGVPSERLQFIRNGVDLKEIDSFLGRGLRQRGNGGVRTVGFVGQLIPRKGLKDLILVFDQLYKDDNKLRLQLLGDGRQRQELEQFVSELPSANAIEFLGFREDRLELMSQFDLFVMTSSLEGIPRCMMEAMAMGIPVAAYDIPGVDQLVDHEVTGLLAPPGDQETLVQCCRRLLTDSKEANRITRAAREKIETVYSARRMAREYEGLFRKLLIPAWKAGSEKNTP